MRGEENANALVYTVTEIPRQKVLFTESRINGDSVPLPFQKYEVRYGDEHRYDPPSITKAVEDNFLGTILTQWPLDIDGNEEIKLGYGEVDFYSGDATTLIQFIKDNNLNLIPRSHKDAHDLDDKPVARKDCATQVGKNPKGNGRGGEVFWLPQKRP